MKKCVKITMNCKNADKAKKNFIQKRAQECGIEGVVQQMRKDNLRMFVCGLFDQVDDFVDSLYVGTTTYSFEDIEVESCANRDYRGVFRVIE